MAEKVEQAQQASLNSQQNNVRKSPEFPGVISRERSFVRTSNQQVSSMPPATSHLITPCIQTGDHHPTSYPNLYRYRYQKVTIFSYSISEYQQTPESGIQRSWQQSDGTNEKQTGHGYIQTAQ